VTQVLIELLQKDDEVDDILIHLVEVELLLDELWGVLLLLVAFLLGGYQQTMLHDNDIFEEQQ
jgi:hypothetical protein